MPDLDLLSQPTGWYQIILLGDRGTCVNLPGVCFVALDSREASIQTHDLLIASPASQPLGHYVAQDIGPVKTLCQQSSDVL